MTARTERVPALHVANGGLGGANNVMVIGWNRLRVNNKAHDIDMQQTDGRGIQRWSHDWDKQMMTHLSYMEIRRIHAETSDPKAGTSFGRHNVTGRYIVKCNYVQQDWPDLSKQLQLRFILGTRLAIFDLGMIVGLMVLDKTPLAVTKIVRDGKWNADLHGVEEMDDDGDSEDLSRIEEESYDDRASGCSDNSDYIAGNEPETPIDLTSDRPVKRQKTENGHPRRLYFQWRGYDTVSGAVKFNPQNCNIGYLDFANDEATTFEGNICMDAQIAIDFQGYQIHGPGGPLTMNWNALSHLASERAKVPEHSW